VLAVALLQPWGRTVAARRVGAVDALDLLRPDVANGLGRGTLWLRPLLLGLLALPGRLCLSALRLLLARHGSVLRSTALAHPRPHSVSHLIAHPAGATPRAAHRLDVRQIDELLRDDDPALLELGPALGALPGGPGMLRGPADAFDHDPVVLGQHVHHTATLPAVLPRDHLDLVVLSDPHTSHGQSTSGASEMIFMNRFS